MKRRILSSLLALVMVVTMLPATALAAEDGPEGGAPIVCIRSEDCTAEKHEIDCPRYIPPVDDDNGIVPESPTAAEQLAELIAALPDPETVNPEDEAQVEEVYNQIFEIYSFAEENGLDMEDNETINAVIAALYPVEVLATNQTVSANTTWSESNTLTGNLTVNSGVTLTLGAQVTISGNVTISGGGTIKRGEDYTGTLLSVPSSGNLTLRDITIDGGATWSGDTAGGLAAEEAAIRIDSGSVTLDSGAVIQNNNHVSITDNSYNHTYYTDNETQHDLPRYYNMGGGIAVYSGTLTMNDGSAVRNSAVTNTNYEKVTTGAERTGNSDSMGGGVGVYENGTFIMNGGEISGNHADVGGGVGRAYGGGVGFITRGKNSQVSSTPDTHKITFFMNGGTISGNSAANGGGGIYGGVDQGDDKTARHTHLEIKIAGAVSDNTSFASGGGIQVGSADLKIENGAEITSNTATSGGGIQIGSATYFTMSGGSVSDNKANGSLNAYGGGIYLNSNADGSLSITGGEIINNSADNSGGGIQITTDLTATIENCTITGNTCGVEDGAVANGGGIQANPGVVLTLSNCTITENTSSSGHGGGVGVSGPRNNAGGTTTLSGSTVISGNTSCLTGPNMYVQAVSAMTTLENLDTQAKIGMTWNSTGVNAEGMAVISGATEVNYGCVVYEPNSDHVLRRNDTNDTGVLKPAIVITLTFNDPEIESGANRPNEETAKFLTLADEEVTFEELRNVCGFAKEGYKIVGWGKNRIGQEGYRVQFPCVVTEKTTIYALWKHETYNVHYELNGGTPGKDAPATHTYGTETQLVSPTRTGYTFDGWFTDAQFSGLAGNALAAKEYTNDITLYAKWTPNTYTISFNGGTGASGSTASRSATYDTLVTLTANDFSMTGKNFAGWSTTENGTTVTYADGATVENLTTEASGTVTLYAVWTDKQVLTPNKSVQTVTYNSEGQLFVLDGYTISYKQNDTEVTNPISAGSYDVVISAVETETTAAYPETVIPGGLVIEKAVLTVTAENKSIYVGDALPAYTYTVTGWQGGDSGETIDGVSVACATADASTANTYPITVTGLEAIDNYTITYVPGTLTVADKATPTLTIIASSTALTGGGSVKLTVTGIPSGGTATVTQTDNQGGEAKTLDLTGNGDISVTLDNKDAKYTFTVSYAGDGGHAAATATCEVSVTRRNSSGGGSGSSDGSTIAGVSGSGDSVNVSASGGTVSSSQMNAAVSKASEGATIEIKATGSAAATLPVSGMKNAAKNYNDVSIATKNGEVTLSAAAIEGLVDGASSGQTIKVSVTAATASAAGLAADTPVFDVSVSVGNAAVHSFDGSLTITLTVSDLSKIENPYVMHILTDGTKQYLKPAVSGGKLTVTGVRGLSYFAVIPGSEVPEELPFTDVAESAYYYDAVRWAYENDITGGTSNTTFSPDATCTRAQVVTFLWRAAGSPVTTGSNPFTDVDSGAYYYDAVLWAVEKGITGGTSATTFSPNATCTRGQIVTFLHRYADSPAVTADMAFTDVASDAYYANAVAWADNEGITGGTGDNQFSPNADCTRGQIVTFLYRQMGK